MQILNVLDFNTIKYVCATTKWLVDVGVAVVVVDIPLALSCSSSTCCYLFMQPLVVVVFIVHSRCVVWFFARYVLLLAKCLLHVAKSINIYYPTHSGRERGRAKGREREGMHLKFIQHAMQMK